MRTDIVERLRDTEKMLTVTALIKLRQDAAKVIEAMRADAAEADERMAADAKEETRLELDAERYGYLRDKTRKDDGTIKERLYVRCDGRNDGRWALTGKELDEALDTALAETNAPVVE
jgi:hypothetical protein